MNQVMITAANTMGQIQKKIDVIGNNIANIDTTGFKKRDARFTELLVQQINNGGKAADEIGRLTPNGIRSGTGAKLAQSKIVLSQGTLTETNRELDTAFTKENQFYRVRNRDTGEIMFTRDGAFYFSRLEGTEPLMRLVTGAGHPVLDENDAPIVIDGETKEVKISENGRVVVTKADGSTQTFTFGVTQIDKPQFLEQKGENLLGFPAAADEAAREAAVTNLNLAAPQAIAIQQHALERSNVDLAKEMTDLINAQRSYQFQARSLSIADQMMGLINGMR